MSVRKVTMHMDNDRIRSVDVTQFVGVMRTTGGRVAAVMQGDAEFFQLSIIQLLLAYAQEVTGTSDEAAYKRFEEAINGIILNGPPQAE